MATWNTSSCKHPVVTKAERLFEVRKSFSLEASEKTSTAAETKEKKKTKQPLVHDPILQRLNANWLAGMRQPNGSEQGHRVFGRDLSVGLVNWSLEFSLRSYQRLAAWLYPNYLCPLFHTNVSVSLSIGKGGGIICIMFCMIHAKVTNYDREFYWVLAED